MKLTEKTISINWKEAKELVMSGKLKGHVSADAKNPELAQLRQEGQIHNQGVYLISEDGKRLYKRRLSSPQAMFDLIAISPELKK